MPTGTVCKAASLEVIKCHSFHVGLLRHLNFCCCIEMFLLCLNWADRRLLKAIWSLLIRQSYAILESLPFKESDWREVNWSKFEAQSSPTNKSSRYYSFRWWRGFVLSSISPRINCVLCDGVPLQLQELGLNLALLSALLALCVLLIWDGSYSCEILHLVPQGDIFIES